MDPVGAASAAVLQELTMSSQEMQLLNTFSSSLLEPSQSSRMDIGSAMRAMEGHMDPVSAAKVVAHRDLAPDVQSMVQQFANGEGNRGNVSRGGTAGFAEPFSEESLATGRKELNLLIEKAWIELD